MKKIFIPVLLMLAGLGLNAQVYVMGNLGNISTCSGSFFDSGDTLGNYGNGENSTFTICSSSGQPIYIAFSQFRLEANWDSLWIYDGNSTAAPLIGGYSGTLPYFTVQSTNGSNCITIRFHSDGSVVYFGWAATIGCGTPPPPPPPPPAPTGTTCATANAFCSGTAYNFPAATNTTAQTGPYYDCVLTQPNPVWYYIQIDTAGQMDLTLSNTNNVDVDFVCWGPFNSSNSCSQLTQANVVDCSYSTAATEHINIPNAQVGEFYTLMITNFSNQPTNFTLGSDATSTASTNCNILCNITGMTAAQGACNPANNTHDVNGSITVQFPPSTGTLLITTSTGQSQTFNAPFTSTVNYTLTGINSTGGTVTVTALFSTDTNCHFTATYTAPSSCTCSVTASNNSPVCEGSPVNLQAAVTGTITNYQWSGPGGYTDTNQNPTIVSATATQSGTYIVSVTAGSCTAVDSTVVLVQPATTITSVVTDATCFGASNGQIVVTANGFPPYTYVWTGSASTNDTANNLAAGPYSVTVTGGGIGCSATANFTVAEPTAVLLGTPNITNATCTQGGSITVTASGGTGAIDFIWSNGDSVASISNLAAGPYDVTATDQNGCSTSATYNINAALNAITFAQAVVSDVTCNGLANGSISTSASGGTGTIDYLWNDGQTTPAITGLAPNIYSVTASDQNGCSASVSYVITEPTAMQFGQPAITNALCSTGGSIKISAIGGTGTITFVWSNTMTGDSIYNLAAGNYTVTATDSSACTITATYTVNPDPNSVILGQPAIVDVSCNGGNDGSVSVTASGGTGTYNYNWSDGQSGTIATGLSAGPITISVTDTNNCLATQTYTVNEPPALAVVVTPQDATCYQAPNGSVTADVTGGTGPYTYLWDDVNAQTTQTAMGLPMGFYTVAVTDSKGCTASGSDSINEPADMVIATSTTPVKCVGDHNGTISVTATGGTQPYNFSATQDFTNFVNATNGVIEGLAVGDYNVVVADNNGCTKTVIATVPNATLDNFTTTTDSTTCYGPNYNDGAAHITELTSQNGPYQYIIDNGISQQSGDFTGLSAGAHTIVVTSLNGCTTSIPIVILEPLPIVVDVVPDTVYLPLGDVQQVQVTYLNANSTVTYAWEPSLGLSCTDCPAPLVSPFTSSDYVITISTVNGSSVCYGSATLHAEVLNPDPVFVPNSFSPNGDGNNDVFKIYGQGIKTIDLRIFNRWGELVYTSNNQFDGWDGTYKGAMQLPSVFTYSVRMVYLNDKTAEKKGTVTLLR